MEYLHRVGAVVPFATGWVLWEVAAFCLTTTLRFSPPYGAVGILLLIAGSVLVRVAAGRVGELAEELEDEADTRPPDWATVRFKRELGRVLAFGGAVSAVAEYLWVASLNALGNSGGFPLSPVPQGLVFIALQGAFLGAMFYGAVLYGINRDIWDQLERRAAKYRPLP